MPDVAVTKRHLSLPWTVAVSAVVGIISGTGVYYSLKGDVVAAKGAGTDASAYTERVEKAHVERFVAAERRIEKLEETGNRTVLLLERIDERTLEMKRQIEESRRGVISRSAN